MKDKLYSAGEAAAVLGVCLQRVYELARGRRRGRHWQGRWQFTAQDIAAMTIRINGRPPGSKKVSRK